MFYLGTLSLNSWAGGQWLDINEVYLAPLIPAAMFFWFTSVSILNSRPLHYGIVSMLLALAMMFSIPNVSYPIGSSWYETLEIALSRVSGFFYAMGTVAYCLVMTGID